MKKKSHVTFLPKKVQLLFITGSLLLALFLAWYISGQNARMLKQQSVLRSVIRQFVLLQRILYGVLPKTIIVRNMVLYKIILKILKNVIHYLLTALMQDVQSLFLFMFRNTLQIRTSSIVLSNFLIFTYFFQIALFLLLFLL